MNINNMYQPKYSKISLRGNNQQKQSNVKTEDLLSISIKENDKIEFCNSSAFIPIYRIMEMINKIFYPAISGYEGCIIEPKMNPLNSREIMRDLNGTPILNTKLFFSYTTKEDGKIKVVKSLVDDKESQNEAYNKIKRFNERKKTRKFALTKEGKEILSEFRDGPRNISDNFETLEVIDNSFGTSRVYLGVANLSIIKFLEKYYGKKNHLNHKVEYEYKLTDKYAAKNIANGNFITNAILEINCWDIEAINQLKSDTGFINYNMAGPGFSILRPTKETNNNK